MIELEEAADIVGEKSLELMRKDKEKRIKGSRRTALAKSIQKDGIIL